MTERSNIGEHSSAAVVASTAELRRSLHRELEGLRALVVKLKADLERARHQNEALRAEHARVTRDLIASELRRTRAGLDRAALHRGPVSQEGPGGASRSGLGLERELRETRRQVAALTEENACLREQVEQLCSIVALLAEGTDFPSRR